MYHISKDKYVTLCHTIPIYVQHLPYAQLICYGATFCRRLTQARHFSLLYEKRKPASSIWKRISSKLMFVCSYAYDFSRPQISRRRLWGSIGLGVQTVSECTCQHWFLHILEDCPYYWIVRYTLSHAARLIRFCFAKGDKSIIRLLPVECTPVF